MGKKMIKISYVGTALFVARKHRCKITRRQLAEKLGIGLRELKDFERGHKTINARVLTRLFNVGIEGITKNIP